MTRPHPEIPPARAAAPGDEAAVELPWRGSAIAGPSELGL